MNIADLNQRDHNTPCLHTKSLHKHRFQCLLGKLTAEPAFLIFSFLNAFLGITVFKFNDFCYFRCLPCRQKSFFMHSAVVPPLSCHL